jgi:hypothetical protein
MANQGNISNITVGVCAITVNGVAIGHTLGGSTLTIDRKFVELRVDQYGETPVELALTGNELKLETTMAEPTLQNIYTAIPEQTEVTGGLGSKLGIGVDAGATLRQYGVPIQLHPVNRALTDLTQDVLIYKAVNDQPVALDYMIDKQRVYKVTFRGLVDENRGNGFRLGQIGLEAIS